MAHTKRLTTAWAKYARSFSVIGAGVYSKNNSGVIIEGFLTMEINLGIKKKFIINWLQINCGDN